MANNIVSFRADFKQAEKYLTEIERKQLPFAKALSLTRTAEYIAGTGRIYKNRGVMQRVLPKIFDRPTRWTLQGFYIEPASKSRRKFFSVVHIKDGSSLTPGRGGKLGTPAFAYLGVQQSGGNRSAKSTEKKLRILGILGDDEVTVPGDAMRLNRYGNLSGSIYSKILADVQNQQFGISQGFGQRTTRRGGKDYFYDPNLRPRGIYRRTSRRRLIVALLFIKNPIYTPRFDFQGISRRAANKRLPIEFRRALAKALATARVR